VDPPVPAKSTERGGRPRHPPSAHCVERYRPRRVIPRSSRERIRPRVSSRALDHAMRLPTADDPNTSGAEAGTTTMISDENWGYP
jgi:hypothetical protein